MPKQTQPLPTGVAITPQGDKVLTDMRTTSELVQEEEEAKKVLLTCLSEHQPEEIANKNITQSQVKDIIDQVAKTKDIAFETAARAIATLIRKGASNAGAKDTMAVEVKYYKTKVVTEVSITKSIRCCTGFIQHVKTQDD